VLKLRVLGMPLVAATALFTCINLSQVPTATAMPAAIQQPNCTKKLTSRPCTSCSQSGVLDIECEGGVDYRECSKQHYDCPNGAQCDNDTATNPC
jgi:hypothetical protein